MERELWPVAVLLTMTWTACSPATRTITGTGEPSAIVRTIRQEVVGSRNMLLHLDIDVHNPGGLLEIVGVRFEILLENRVFATGTSNWNAQIPENLSTNLLVPIELSYLSLPHPTQWRLENGGQPELVVRGVLLAKRKTADLNIGFHATTKVSFVE